MKIIEKNIKISGMTCASCEKTITRTLRSLDGIKNVKVSYKVSNAIIKYDEEVIKENEIIKAIENAGYGVNKNNDKLELAYMAFILLGLYIIIKHTIGFDFGVEIDESFGYGMLFVVGLLTSFHCISMCGGINLSQCIKRATTDKPSVMPSLLYNLGRVVAYTLIGGIVGALGGVISLSNTFKNLISILAGLFMILMGLKMLNIIPQLRNVNLGIPKKLRGKINKRNKSPFIVGLLNGLMPCGPLQSMQVYALGTGSAVSGALSMFFFSVGTFPLMFGFGSLGSFITGKYKQKLTKFSALLVIVLGLVMANRGLDISFGGNGGTKAVKRDGVQYVETSLTNGNYQPITVEKGTKVEWVINVNGNDLSYCNRQMVINEYGIKIDLHVGRNVIKFTPNESGTFSYYCSMRMIRSKITVVDSL